MFCPEKIESRKDSVPKKFSTEEVQSKRSSVQKKFSPEEVQSRIPQEKVNSKYLPHNVWYCSGPRTYSGTYPDLYQTLLTVFSCCIFQHIASYGVRDRVRVRAGELLSSSES